MSNATLKENYNMLKITKTHLVYASNLCLYRYMYKYIEEKAKQEQSDSICEYENQCMNSQLHILLFENQDLKILLEDKISFFKRTSYVSLIFL